MQHSRLSAEAVLAVLATNGYVEPLYVQDGGVLDGYFAGSSLKGEGGGVLVGEYVGVLSISSPFYVGVLFVV